MKKIIMALAILGSTLLMAGGDIKPAETAVVAEVPSSKTGLYAGVGLGVGYTYTEGNFDFSDDVAGESYVDPMVGLKVGYDFYKTGDFTAAVEGRLMSSFNSNDFDTTVYSAFLVPKYEVMRDGRVYGLIGASRVRYNVGNDTESYTDFAFGLGAEYDITKDVSVSVDWTSNMWNNDKDCLDDLNNDIVAMYVTYKF
jgi:opacity protein-like surface antigen